MPERQSNGESRRSIELHGASEPKLLGPQRIREDYRELPSASAEKQRVVEREDIMRHVQPQRLHRKLKFNPQSPQPP